MTRNTTPARRATAIGNPDEQLARVLARKRAGLLSGHWHALGREDLEEALAQAVLEVLLAARRRTLVDERHLENLLMQKFRSRIIDRRRALAGRSPIEHAIATSLRLDEVADGLPEIVDARLDVEGTVLARDELHRIALAARERLSAEERLVLANRAGGGRAGEFTSRQEWGSERYRKVGQRGRAQLRAALAA